MAGEDNGWWMEGEGAVFPVYRRTADGRHAYRVESHGKFTEVQVVGNRRIVHRVTATAYPELVRIRELLQGCEGRYLPMGQQEWEEELRRATEAS